MCLDGIERVMVRTSHIVKRWNKAEGDLQTNDVGVLKSVEYVDVPLTRASSVSTIVSAYTVSPWGSTVTAAMPAVVANMSCVNGGVVLVTVLVLVCVRRE